MDAAAQVLAAPAPDLLTYAPGGGALLREALADYLRTSRSVRCTPEQIVITTGIHQSIDLAVRLLTDPGDAIWTEDPCYWGVRSVLNVSGLTTRPIPVDDEGIAPSAADLAEPPKLMLVTPSHQYPLGMVMSLARRRMLLEYARQHGCWIIEDDYDSEFRYGSRPLASLQGLDTAGQVIYVGSFGKTLFPGCGSVIWLHRSRSRKVSRPPAPSCIAKGSCCSRRCWPSSSRKDTSCRISARCARYMGSAAVLLDAIAQRRHAARARQRCGAASGHAVAGRRRRSRGRAGRA